MNDLLSFLDKSEFPANVLCIDQFSNVGGGQRSLLDMLPAFSERGWRPSVAIPGDGPFAALVRSLGYRTHSFAFGSYRSKKKPLIEHLRYAFELPGLVHSLVDLVDAHETDLLYVNGPRLVPPAAWVAWRRGIPLVFHCHNRLQQSSAIALTGQALELASAHVIACCQYAAEPLREYVAPERLQIALQRSCGNGASGGCKRRERTRTIGVIGRVEAEKGPTGVRQGGTNSLRESCRSVGFE